MRNNLLLLYLFSAFLLVGCGVNEKANENNDEKGTNATNFQESEDKAIEKEIDYNYSHKAVNESTWGELPEGIKEAKNPKYPVGTKVIINAAHEEGMEGQEGVIVGAYDTIAYSVTYKSTTDGQEQVNHKWVVKEEVKGIDEEALKEHSEVIINADRESGMKGAEGIIETIHDTTVYMVDYTATDNRNIKNYQWFIEDELSKKE